MKKWHPGIKCPKHDCDMYQDFRSGFAICRQCEWYSLVTTAAFLLVVFLGAFAYWLIWGR